VAVRYTGSCEDLMGLTLGEKATVENLARASGPSLRFLILFGPGRCQEKYHFVVYLWVL